jgi:hypothetical protein
MKQQEFFKLWLMFLMFFTSSMLIFGCGNKQDGEFASDKDTQVTEENIAVNKKGLELKDDEESMLHSSLNQIDLDKWKQLVEDLKNALGEMEEVSKEVLQTSERR